MTKLSWVLVMGVSSLLAACEGPAGPAGPPGTAPDEGSGPQGTPGPGLGEGDLVATCMTPCHTFDGVVQQWRTSTHFAVSVRELGGEEVESWTAPNSTCGNCHAIDAHQQRAGGNIGSKGGAPPNAANGQTNYLDTGTQKLGEATYAGSAKLASVYCTTCHKVTEDPHKTGDAAYKPGTFAYWVPTGNNDEAFIEKSPTQGAVTGQPAGKLQTGNVCVWCHKARKDVTQYITAKNTLSSIYWGPHLGPHADVYSSKGGYHYPGQSYSSNHPHMTVNKGCVGCHMPPVPGNQNIGNHSFFAQISACTGCHSATKNFDVNQGQTTVTKGLTELRAALNKAGYLTRSAASEPLTAEELEDNDFSHDEVRATKPPTVVGPEVAGAIWNYLLVARGGALGVHQPTYVKQLLWDSIQAITGAQPTFLSARP